MVANYYHTQFLLLNMLVLSIHPCLTQITNDSLQKNYILRPLIKMGAPTHLISGEHISFKFYAVAERSNQAKNNLQNTLQKFLENLQKNLTTSTILNTVNTIDVKRTQKQLRKLTGLSVFFEMASEKTVIFALESENFFEVTKNESNSLLLKLRQVHSAQRFLPMQIKFFLTNYFAEMEFFHIMFSEIIDEALEYIVETLHSTQRTFIQYADIQKDVLYNWNFKPDEWCCNRYMDFLQHWSAQIFKCAAGVELNTAYDVYAITEVTTKYLLKQLEFRVQRLYNCFLFGSIQLRCRFLRHAEQDFEKLFAKLDELQTYYDIKTKRGRVTIPRHRRRIHIKMSTKAVTERKNNSNVSVNQEKCIPFGFPETQMLINLKACFYFPDFE